MSRSSRAASPDVTRRQMLHFTAASAGIIFLAPTSGCTIPVDSAPAEHPLRALLDTALTDLSRIAQSAAPAEDGTSDSQAVNTALSQLNAARTRHVEALREALIADGEEIQPSTTAESAAPTATSTASVAPNAASDSSESVTGTTRSTVVSESDTGSTSATTTVSAAPATPSELRELMRSAAQQAREAALGDYGYRRVLAASIAASCTTAAEVLLAPLIA